MNRLTWTAFLLAFTAAASVANAENDEQAIRACFKNYQTAIAKKDGNAAAALLSKASLFYYGSILNLALNGEEAKVRQQHFYRKMMVLLVRHEAGQMYRTAGYSTNASDFFALIVKKGWGGEVASTGVELGKISIDSTIATAPAMLNGQATPARLVFERERSGWKLALLHAILRMDKLMADKQKTSPLSEDDAIIKTLEMRSGRPVSKDIWKPLKAK